MADDNTTTERLVRIEAILAGLATKADLAELVTKADLAGVAKNVDVTALGRQLREMRDELRVTSAMVLRLDHIWPDIIEQLRAMVQQQLGVLDRLRALEEPPGHGTQDIRAVPEANAGAGEAQAMAYKSRIAASSAALKRWLRLG
jgi:hypothetical protein